jgi:UDP-N-acetylglucosamine acyltransferase
MPIHALAVVDPAADVHPEAIIGPFCVVQGRVTIGKGSELRNHATIYGRATIGEGCVLFPGCVVGSDPQDLKFRGEDSETIIGNGVRIHECVTISKGTASGGMKTVVGDNTLVMAYAHVGHDCIVDNNVVIANNAQIAGHVRIGRKATIGGMVGVHHFATVGELTYVGSMSGIRVDMPPFTIVEGNPAEPKSINVVGCRRDGMDDDTIRALRDVYKILYYDREKTGLGLRESIAKCRDLHPTPAAPVERLLSWQQEHLDTNVKGRVQEAHRQPAIGVGSAAKTAPTA